MKKRLQGMDLYKVKREETLFVSCTKHLLVKSFLIQDRDSQIEAIESTFESSKKPVRTYFYIEL